MTMTIDLSDEQRERLGEVARRLNVPAETLVAAWVRDLLARPDAEFDAVAARVLEKNRELYERLA